MAIAHMHLLQGLRKIQVSLILKASTKLSNRLKILESLITIIGPIFFYRELTGYLGAGLRQGQLALPLRP
jgi:hypothetical protein